MQCSIVQCSAVQCRGMLCSVVQCSVVQCSVVQCSVVQCSVVQCSVVQCSVVLCGVVQCTSPKHRPCYFHDWLKLDSANSKFGVVRANQQSKIQRISGIQRKSTQSSLSQNEVSILLSTATALLTSTVEVNEFHRNYVDIYFPTFTAFQSRTQQTHYSITLSECCLPTH